MTFRKREDSVRTRPRCVENSLWKMLWNCPKTTWCRWCLYGLRGSLYFTYLEAFAATEFNKISGRQRHQGVKILLHFGDRVSPWNPGEFQQVDSSVCLRRFCWAFTLLPHVWPSNIAITGCCTSAFLVILTCTPDRNFWFTCYSLACTYWGVWPI
jgi:hypothetical protein